MMLHRMVIINRLKKLLILLKVWYLLHLIPSLEFGTHSFFLKKDSLKFMKKLKLLLITFSLWDLVAVLELWE